MQMNSALNGSGWSQDRDDLRFFLFENAKTYLCLNHRTAYLCWIDALKRNFIRNNALLIHIDHHADFWLGEPKLLLEESCIDLSDNSRLEEFVRTKMNKLNADFLVFLLYRGIIGDVISVDRKHEDIYGTFIRGTYKTTDKNIFQDSTGKIHSFYRAGPLMELVGYQGLLTDRGKYQDIQTAFKNNSRKNTVLDIDLDYFTYQDEGTWAMNERNLETILLSESFKYLLGSATIITVALEPSCCGGIIECQSILNKINSLVFNERGIDIKEKAGSLFETQSCK